ncbi:DUF1294 domain-containing protein [Methanoregula sp.]|uniref:DUF1294 domain-containing protein n=1 Tax=Methanoregula sp. TaxID=2052170 RepID=UPI003C778C83
MVIPNVLFFVVVLYLVSNILAFGAFAFDKWKAQRTAWRISENALLALAFLGPFGGFCAMRLYRHKIHKIKFYLVPVFLVIHLAIIVYLAGMLLQPGMNGSNHASLIPGFAIFS